MDKNCNGFGSILFCSNWNWIDSVVSGFIFARKKYLQYCYTFTTNMNFVKHFLAFVFYVIFQNYLYSQMKTDICFFLSHPHLLLSFWIHHFLYVLIAIESIISIIHPLTLFSLEEMRQVLYCGPHLFMFKIEQIKTIKKTLKLNFAKYSWDIEPFLAINALFRKIVFYIYISWT